MATLCGIDFLLMSAEEPETEAGAANDATEVVDEDRLREAAGGQAWSEADDDADDDGPESHPWSVVTGQAAALISAGAAVATITAVLGWIMLHNDRAAPSPVPPTSKAEKNTSPTAAAVPAPPPPANSEPPSIDLPPPMAAAPPLDGTYQLQGPNLTPMLYGFRYACAPPKTRPLGPATECNATGAQLDSANPNAQAGGFYTDPDALNWVNGQWRGAEQTRHRQCSTAGQPGAPPGGTDADYATTWSMSLEPQSSDGSSYRGTLVQAVLPNGCGMQVGTERSVFTARRVGPRPPHADW